jgi:hypothetical protein
MFQANTAFADFLRVCHAIAQTDTYRGRLEIEADGLFTHMAFTFWRH